MRFSTNRLWIWAGFFAVGLAACADSPAPLEQEWSGISPTNVALGSIGITEQGGACMGDDVVSFNQIASGNDRVSGWNQPVPSGNVCTSNDIYLASASVREVWANGGWQPVNGPITCVEGESFDVRVTASLGQNASSPRTDIGVWVGQGEQNFLENQALTGTCAHYYLDPEESADFDGDQCGDMSQALGEVDLDLDVLTLQCLPNEDGKVELPACIGWTQPGQDRFCPYPEGEEDPINFRYGTVPGNTSKCNCESFELDIIVLKQAHLEIRKELDPTDDGGSFNLIIEDQDEVEMARADEQRNEGTTGKVELGAGTNVAPGMTYSFREEGFGETVLAHYETSWECRDRGDSMGSRGSGDGPGPHDITLQPEDDVVCTFTNARKPQVKLAKVFAPDNGGKVSFTIDGTLYDQGGTGFGHNDHTDWIIFDIGADVSFSEAGFGDTDLDDYMSSWMCDNGESGDGTSGSTGELEAGDMVTCTFTNVQNPQVRLAKAFDPADDGGKVSFTINGTIDDNEEAGYGNGGMTGWYSFAVGDDVSFIEAGFGGTNLADYMSSWMCSNGASGEGTSGSTGELAAGDMVTCTFTNVRMEEEVQTETAWAANGDVPLEFSFNRERNNGRGNWATYVQYEAKTVTFFAGRTTPVGTVTFGEVVDGEVEITIELSEPWMFYMDSDIAIQGYDRVPRGNPAPGRFEYKFSPSNGYSWTGTVDAAAYYAVHGVVTQHMP